MKGQIKDRTFELPAVLAEACTAAPLTIADVGARGGLQPRFQPIARHVTWIGFEPDARSSDALPAAAVPARSHVLPVALSDRRGTVTLHRTRDEGDSSLLKPNQRFLAQFGHPERFDVVDTVELPADTLDAQLATIGVAEVDVLKLDTQGTELTILRGAGDTLDRGVLAVDVEVEFSPLYEEQPLFADVDTHLRRFGLQLMDLAPRRGPYVQGEHLNLARGPVLWAEAVYFPTVDALAADLSARPAGGRPRLAKACLVALLYGFGDYALAVIERMDARGGDMTPLRDAVAWWDAHAPQPRVPVTIEAPPDQFRALQRARRETGVKPTQQLRRLLQQWVKGKGTAPS